MLYVSMLCTVCTTCSDWVRKLSVSNTLLDLLDNINVSDLFSMPLMVGKDRMKHRFTRLAYPNIKTAGVYLRKRELHRSKKIAKLVMDAIRHPLIMRGFIQSRDEQLLTSL